MNTPNPWGSPDIAGQVPATGSGPTQAVSISGLVVSPPPVVVAANTSTLIPLGVPSVRQITIQNNTPNPIYRSYSNGGASQASLAISPGTQQIDTVTSIQLYLYGTSVFTVNGGPGQVVVEVYS